MGRYLIRRLLWVVLVLVLITLFTFFIFFVMPPTDPAILFAGRAPTPRLVAQVRDSLGLDQPAPVQYLLFLRRLFLGDEYGWPGFGFSFLSRSPIKPVLFSRLLVTFQLAIGAAVLWLFLGVVIGIISALNKGKIADRLAMGFALLGVSAPVFWLGLMALWIFWQQLDILPGTGYVAPTEDFGQWFMRMILPWSVLSLLFAAFYARMVRSNLLETLDEDYIRTARAKGLSERKVVFKHALRSSLTPVVSLFGVDFGTLLGGAIITETVFNLPGLGTYVVRAVGNGDLPVILAVVVFAGLGVAIMSLVVDVLYAFLDPRVKYA
ncbi:MAG TPA: ABC transporter permease [Actinomycetota bacterium]